MRRRFGRILRQTLNETQNVPPALQEANQLFGAGNYAAAAPAFEELAKRAEGRNGPRAPFFYLQAGRARLLLNEFDICQKHFKHALNLLIESQRYAQLYRTGTNIVQELKAHGREAEAREISQIIHSNTLAISETTTQLLPAQKLALPTHCPSCGGPLRSDEAEWIDDVTAECPFCGSPIRAA